MSSYYPIVAFCIALLSSALFTPLLMRLAKSVGMVDRPDAKRKLHRKPIPLAGGMAIYASVAIAVFAAAIQAGSTSEIEWPVLQGVAGIGVGAIVLLGIGLIDDRFGMRGRHKLLGQILAVVLFLIVSHNSNIVTLFGWRLPEPLSILLIVIWIVGTINAINLIDGADGMASTVGVIAAIALTIMSIGLGRGPESIIAAALAGSLLAFLVFNLPPASVFLGDSGSMLIGFLIGAIAIDSSNKEAAAIMLVAPAAVVAIPLFDSLVAIMRRRLTGRSIYATDRGHIHHTLMARGYGPRKMLILVGVLSAITAIGGTMSVMFASSWFAIVSILLVLGFLVLGRVFGFAEFVLLTNRLIAMGNNLRLSPEERSGKSHQQTTHLQGSRNWGHLWEAITEFAEEHRLAQVRLDLNLPWLHEGYHATWQRPVRIDRQESWNTSLPISANGKNFGRLEVVGAQTQQSVYLLLSLLAELLESMENVIIRLANEEPMATMLANAASGRASMAPSSSVQTKTATASHRGDPGQQPIGNEFATALPIGVNIAALSGSDADKYSD